MQSFINAGYKHNNLRCLNLCGLFLQAATVANLVNVDGQFVSLSAWKGDSIESNACKQYDWPVQDPPPLNNDWLFLQRALTVALSISTARKLRVPLTGEWMMINLANGFMILHQCDCMNKQLLEGSITTKLPPEPAIKLCSSSAGLYGLSQSHGSTLANRVQPASLPPFNHLTLDNAIAFLPAGAALAVTNLDCLDSQHIKIIGFIVRTHIFHRWVTAPVTKCCRTGSVAKVPKWQCCCSPILRVWDWKFPNNTANIKTPRLQVQIFQECITEQIGEGASAGTSGMWVSAYVERLAWRTKAYVQQSTEMRACSTVEMTSCKIQSCETTSRVIRRCRLNREMTSLFIIIMPCAVEPLSSSASF